jgi:hypothetical protein
MSTYDPFTRVTHQRAEPFRSSMNRYRSAFALTLAVATAGCWVTNAQAKEEFPGQIERDVTGVDYQVPCAVCHIKGNTGGSTPITPFALSLRDRGLSGDTASLSSALLQLAADGTDSDGDGVGDIDELKAKTDPNSSANADIATVQAPGYGCGGTAPHGGGGPAAASALSLAWLLLRRRRGTTRPFER